VRTCNMLYTQVFSWT